MPERETDLVKRVGIVPFEDAEPIPVGKLPSDGTQVAKYLIVDNAINQVHTVSAGKTLYLHSCFLQVRNDSGGAERGYLVVRNDTDVEQYYLAYINLQNGSHGELSLAFPTPLEIAEGWDISLKSTGAGLVAVCSIFGYEV